MSSDVQTRLMATVYACLRPFARVLLRSGVTYKSFAEIAKSAFVHEAMLERDSKGRKTNASRVAVRTGLSRKEVRRVSEQNSPNDRPKTGAADHAGPPARVLHTWHFDPRFLGPDGSPLDLCFEGESPSFAELVKAAGGDVPPGAVRAELFRAAAVLELENGLLRPTKRYFVPGDFDEKAITVMSGMLFPFLSGVDHNSNPARKSAGFIQRIAYARLSPEDREAFRVWSRAEATRFIESIDDWLTAREIQADESVADPISGVGVFYYEGPEAAGLPKPESELGQ
jgi:Family of unknown function (DUF6502)